MNIIPFESSVRDRVTRFRGIVIYRVEHMNNCVRYGVQPLVDEKGKLADNKVLDGPNLEIVAPPKDGSSAKETPNVFELGVKVRDRFSGFEGIAVLRVKHRHSGDQYGIQPPVDEKNEIPDIRSFDEEDLKQIDPSPPKKKNKRKKKLPNGPHDHNTAIAR